MKKGLDLYVTKNESLTSTIGNHNNISFKNSKIHMFNSKLENLLQSALLFARKYASEIGESVLISEHDYQGFIVEQRKQFEQNFNRNKFIICANLKADALENCVDTREVMGWASDISVEDYFRKVHPDYLSPYLNWSMAVYALSIELRGKLSSFGQVYQIQIPIQHENGKYYWCIMQGFPIRFDKDLNMTVNCNIYQRMEEMNPFNHRLFQPFLIERLEIVEDWNTRLAAKMKAFVTDPLNINELKTIKLVLSGKTTAEIALEMKVSKNTIMSYKKNILKRGHDIGGKIFSNAIEVGEYFNSLGWIKINDI